MSYLATFFTHFGAVSFKKRLDALGDKPGLMPVPRRLSASCGVCVRFSLPFEAALPAPDLDRVYAVEGADYREVYAAEDGED